MHPVGIVEGPEDQVLDVHQAAGVLPAPGLVAPDEAAQDAGVADRVVGPADGAGSSRGTGMYFSISSTSSCRLIRYSVIQVVMRLPPVL